MRKSARAIVNAELDAIGIPEIELGEIAVKVLFSAVLVNADHAALEDAIVALDSVGADSHATLPVNVGVFPAP